MEARGPTCQAGSVFERFTDSARQVLVLAQEEARLLGHSFIGTEHLLLGILHQGGTAAEVLTELGASLPATRDRVEETIGLTGAPSGSPPFTPRAMNVVGNSL
jgi:ATP-dependent Clp protease ATP-binding subunit ClpC